MARGQVRKPSRASPPAKDAVAAAIRINNTVPAAPKAAPNVRPLCTALTCRRVMSSRAMRVSAPTSASGVTSVTTNLRTWPSLVTTSTVSPAAFTWILVQYAPLTNPPGVPVDETVAQSDPRRGHGLLRAGARCLQASRYGSGKHCCHDRFDGGHGGEDPGAGHRKGTGQLHDRHGHRQCARADEGRSQPGDCQACDR